MRRTAGQAICWQWSCHIITSLSRHASGVATLVQCLLQAHDVYFTGRLLSTNHHCTSRRVGEHHGIPIVGPGDGNPGWLVGEADEQLTRRLVLSPCLAVVQRFGNSFCSPKMSLDPARVQNGWASDRVLAQAPDATSDILVAQLQGAMPCSVPVTAFSLLTC